MSTMELEAQKAYLAREILALNNEAIINNIRLIIDENNSFSVLQQKTKNDRRKIGILDGKAKIVFHDDWSMTPEELGMI